MAPKDMQFDKLQILIRLLTKSVCARIFNIFSKNFVAELNNTIHEERKRQPAPVTKDRSSSRKIKKLQSE